MKSLIPLGIFLILLGFAVVIAGSLMQPKVAAGGVIGFIPFGFANDKRLLYFIYGAIVLMFLVWIFLNIKNRS